MKYFICSDIHGSYTSCQKIIEHFNSFKCDAILLLGDILYHGPRNDLPEGHNPKMVVELLNQYSDKIIACRGNCEAEVDQMVLKFPCMQDYIITIDDGTKIFATHGHLFSPETVPQDFDVYLSGHTHVQVLERAGTKIICNPGSTSLPKNSSSAGFAIYENRTVSLYDINGAKLKSVNI